MQVSALGLPRRPENLYQRTLVDYEALKLNRLNSILGNDAERLYEVPYGFCSDGQASGYDIACHPFIYGSDPAEIVQYAIKDFELAKRLTEKGGDVLPATVPAYLNYVYRRVYAPILRTYQWMYLAKDSEDQIMPGMHDLVVGTKIGLDFIARVLQAVEPGEYCKDATGNYILRADKKTCQDPLFIDGILGKQFRSTFGTELIAKEEHIGYIYDKILAFLALIDDQPIISHQF